MQSIIEYHSTVDSCKQLIHSTVDSCKHLILRYIQTLNKSFLKREIIMLSTMDYICYTGIFFCACIIYEHVARLCHWSVRIVYALQWIARGCQWFFNTCGVLFARISNFIQYLHLGDLGITLCELAQSFWSILQSPRHLFIGYFSYVQAYLQPYREHVYLGSIVICVAILILGLYFRSHFIYTVLTGLSNTPMMDAVSALVWIALMASAMVWLFLFAINLGGGEVLILASIMCGLFTVLYVFRSITKPI
jgi:hypothetical protein